MCLIVQWPSRTGQSVYLLSLYIYTNWHDASVTILKVFHRYLKSYFSWLILTLVWDMFESVQNEIITLKNWSENFQDKSFFLFLAIWVRSHEIGRKKWAKSLAWPCLWGGWLIIYLERFCIREISLFLFLFNKWLKPLFVFKIALTFMEALIFHTFFEVAKWTDYFFMSKLNPLKIRKLM